MKSTIKCLIPALLLLSTQCFGSNSEVSKRNRELKKIDTKIAKLQQRLLDTKGKRNTIQQELKALDTKINALSKNIHDLLVKIKLKQTSIDELEKQLTDLTLTLNKQSDLLAQQARMTYLLGKNQASQLILNQQSPTLLNRLLTYYGYINEYRSKLISDVLTTKKTIEVKDSALTRELGEIKQLKTSLDQKKIRLVEEQRYQQQVIDSLNHQIIKSKKSLVSYVNDKKRLELLLSKLKKAHRSDSPLMPFPKMRHKLPWPTRGKVIAQFGSKETINQLDSNGITILAPEGQKVSAVFPGKVVFADWLRGYGLLLIIDHGNGYMTLYAHNQTLLKTTGDTVNQGEIIALVGHSGGFRQNSLYFEIRRNGKPSNPLSWLV